MGHATFQSGELTAVIGDNAAHGEHRAGYNGLWSLRHRTLARDLFVPSVAGLNLEHIFNGEPVPGREVFFEPRTAPMSLRRLSATEAELHQPPTPTFHLESWTRFRLVAPHYVDTEFRCVAHQHVFPRGWIGLFWASYINAPEDKGVYFLGEDPARPGRTLWHQFSTQQHNRDSTVRHREDRLELDFAPDATTALYKNVSPLRFSEPFFYGCFDDHVFLVMFDRSAGLRFTHSPSGGGINAEHRTANPAWDFQWIIPRYAVGREYVLRWRAALRPRCPRSEIEDEFRRWRAAL
jgi:hypothetical protein